MRVNAIREPQAIRASLVLILQRAVLAYLEFAIIGLRGVPDFVAGMTVLRPEFRRDMRDHIVVMCDTEVVVWEFGENVLAELSISYTGLAKGVQSDIFFCQVKVGLKVKCSQ